MVVEAVVLETVLKPLEAVELAVEEFLSLPTTYQFQAIFMPMAILEKTVHQEQELEMAVLEAVVRADQFF